MLVLDFSTFQGTVCEEHGVWDSLPCPWPGCSQGIEEDRFQQRPYIRSGTSTIFARKQWRSLDQGVYYSWEGADLPHWLSVPKTFWNEARRLGLSDTGPPALIYHYTNLEGFVGIVQSRSLWLSDYSYLNDKRELTHGIEAIREIIAEMLKASQRDELAELMRTWERKLAIPGSRVCIASFSSDDDSLSQWRAYGPIAIGIGPQYLTFHAYPANLRAVEYDCGRQRKLAEFYLSHIAQSYEADLSAGRSENISDFYHRTDRLVELAAFFKDPAFRTEHEYRLAYIEYPETMQSLQLDSPPKHFRVSKSRLLPYVSSNELYPLRVDRKLLEIQEVVLGPETDELLERGVREFLAASEMPEVVVRRSTVPYRT
jgi:hypothetical protein